MDPVFPPPPPKLGKHNPALILPALEVTRRNNASLAQLNKYRDNPAETIIEFSEPFQDLFRPARYKIYYGGRGGCKSWSVARALILIAHTSKKRIGCFRELQNSIKDSVHKLLVDQIEKVGLLPWFRITKDSITSRVTGSEFIFKGLRLNATEIKSTEGIDIAWVEEAQLVSETSWEILIPTIRNEGSEIWITFNPINEEDATYQRFVIKAAPDWVVHKVNWDTNPWFPQVLELERLHMLATDPEAYEHVWGGGCRTVSEAVIFRNKYVIDTFAPDYSIERFHYGLDFGFSGDPMCVSRSYITGKPPVEELWIEYACFAYGIEIDEYPAFINNSVPDAKRWPIKADNARPESISYIKRQGFNCSAAEKWQGCVEDRIAHLKAYKIIHIHQRNKQMQQEARLYSYKVDKITGEVLPIVVDRHNHGWDSVGYSLDGYIQKRGIHRVWENL
jgi:phage terminase large subunit